jgi:hypothetical protein
LDKKHISTLQRKGFGIKGALISLFISAHIATKKFMILLSLILNLFPPNERISIKVKCSHMHLRFLRIIMDMKYLLNLQLPYEICIAVRCAFKFGHAEFQLSELLFIGLIVVDIVMALKIVIAM